MTNHIKKEIKDSILNENTKKRMNTNMPIIFRIFSLPKVCKKGVPIRPIIDTMNSLTYKLVQEYIGLRIKEGDLLVSFNNMSCVIIPIEYSMRGYF